MAANKIIWDPPRFELREVYSDGTEEEIEIYSLQDLIKEVEKLSMDRRQFLKFSAFTAAVTLVASCRPAPAPTPTPTRALKSTLTHTSIPQVIEAGAKCTGLAAHTGGIYSVTFSPDGALLASGGGDGLKLWRVSDGSMVHKLHGSAVNSVVFSPDGSLLASGGKDCTVRLWQVSNRSEVYGSRPCKTGQLHPVYSVAFSPDGSLLAATGEGCSVWIWQVSNWNLVHKLKEQRCVISSIAFSPDGKLLASGGNEGIVWLWQMKNRKIVRKLKGLTSFIIDIAFSPDGSLLASGGFDSVMMMWQVSDGSVVHALRGNVTSIAFSPDGSLLASGGMDGTVRLWRVSDGNMVGEFRGHEGGVEVAFSPDGSLLATGDSKGTIRLWDMVGLKGVLDVCFFDPAATPAGQEARTYKITDAQGITRTYTMPCGTPIPPGAICTCNCIPGTYAPGVPGRPGGVICTCDKVCVCIPVPRKYCFVMFK